MLTNHTCTVNLKAYQLNTSPTHVPGAVAALTSLHACFHYARLSFALLQAQESYS